MIVTEDFKKVAISFAGGDGGNPNSDVWFCGLEWGIGDEASPDDFYKKLNYLKYNCKNRYGKIKNS